MEWAKANAPNVTSKINFTKDVRVGGEPAKLV
jgi:hypothetical protein